MGRHTFGMVVVKVKVNFFATDRIKKQKKLPLNLIVKILKKYFFVVARKAKTHHFVMELTNY